MERQGIISAGNWLIDHIKMIDAWPERGNLTNIRFIAKRAPGGCSHNVLVDLARMQTGIPLWAGGIVGDDDDGNYILGKVRENGIDDRYMSVRPGVSTSFTDVMSETSTGARTFFHHRGANAILDHTDFEAMDAPAKIFHLGYLLLLDRLDAADEQHGTVAAKVLRHLKAKGYATSVDVVSEQGQRFRDVVTPCLKYVDYMICNEVEASACTGIDLRDDAGILPENLPRAAACLFDQGVNRLVVVHFPEGGFAASRDGQQALVPSREVPRDAIKSTVGAGDAFCAGALYAIHEGLPLRRMLQIANANARFNLLSENSTDGAVALPELLQYVNQNYEP
ncbi:MAG: carbohydrate kinase family protein [Odoribacteraceae bacterium]|jgi:sugar/nucleoside kinase (ribokinase family)|nr:carbohydrate kinase family protein [Odoribacteraceae bacterium]